METTKGEIYFIREMEVGQFSAHTKIGLISYKKDRSSSDRLPEHQTGNPRKLVIVHVVKTDCVTAVETYMHRKYASWRGLGEWFQFDERLLTEAIHFCEQIASRFAGEAEVLDRSKALKDQKSIGVVADTSDEATQWFQKLVSTSSLIQECESMEAKYEDLIREAQSSGVEISRAAKIQSRESSSFNEIGFKKKYEKLWLLHAQEVSVIGGKFVVEKFEKNNVVSSSDFPEFVLLRDRFIDALESGETHSVKLEAVKGCYLELIGFSKEAKVDKDIAEAHLKVLCGTSDGISGICKWKRTEKSTFILDKKSLEANHPLEYKEFLVKTTSEVFTSEKGLGA